MFGPAGIALANSLPTGARVVALESHRVDAGEVQGRTLWRLLNSGVDQLGHGASTVVFNLLTFPLCSPYRAYFSLSFLDNCCLIRHCGDAVLTQQFTQSFQQFQAYKVCKISGDNSVAEDSVSGADGRGETPVSVKAARIAIMQRQAGAGLMGLGLVLVAVGAILAYAVTATATGFSIHTVGVIVLIVGVIAFAVALMLFLVGDRRRSTVREDVREVPGGTSRTIERDDRLP